MTVWEEVVVPAGSFIGWGTKPGQHVTGIVTAYSIDGGVDYNGAKCPLLSVKLTEPAASFNKEGERTDHPAGADVNITCGQVKLKSGVAQANLTVGDEVKVEMARMVKTATGNTMKEFRVLFARGTGAQPAATATIEDDSPPF